MLSEDPGQDHCVWLSLSPKVLPFVISGGILIGFSTTQALAQFSARDGYAEDGGYRVQVELTPYLWLPASSGTARIGGSLGRNFNFDSGPPTIADLAHSLHGAFVGYGLLRYGPWSADLDTQWIDAFHKSSVQLGANGPG